MTYQFPQTLARLIVVYVATTVFLLLIWAAIITTGAFIVKWVFGL